MLLVKKIEDHLVVHLMKKWKIYKKFYK